MIYCWVGGGLSGYTSCMVVRKVICFHVPKSEVYYVHIFANQGGGIIPTNQGGGSIPRK